MRQRGEISVTTMAVLAIIVVILAFLWEGSHHTHPQGGCDTYYSQQYENC